MNKEQLIRLLTLTAIVYMYPLVIFNLADAMPTAGILNLICIVVTIVGLSAIVGYLLYRNIVDVIRNLEVASN